MHSLTASLWFKERIRNLMGRRAYDLTVPYFTWGPRTRDMLADLGYEVLTAGLGEEAFQLFGEHHGRIDIVLTDVVMPEMGGMELIEKM